MLENNFKEFCLVLNSYRKDAFEAIMASHHVNGFKYEIYISSYNGVTIHVGATRYKVKPCGLCEGICGELSDLHKANILCVAKKFLTVLSMKVSEMRLVHGTDMTEMFNEFR